MIPIPKHLKQYAWYPQHLRWLIERGYAVLHDPGEGETKRANLTRANLTEANLTWANLTEADLTEANLTRANLTEANLTWANLTRANLTEADLTRANLTEANLTEADLTEANLTRANLTWANLTRANLTWANLTWAKNDVLKILDSAPAEVAGLRSALVAGRINGSVYTGECACLVGTLAKVRGCAPEKMECGLNSGRPAERWFMALSPGDTPETSQAAKITLEWIDEWIASKTPASK